MVHKGGCLHGRKGERPRGGCKVGRKNEKTGRRRRRLEIVYDDEPVRTDGETHVMPNGDVHTGATHTASSRLVASADQIAPAKVAGLLGMLTDQELHVMSTHNTNPFPEGFQAAPMYESEEEESEEETTSYVGRIRLPARNRFGEVINQVIGGMEDPEYPVMEQYFTDTPPGKATIVYERNTEQKTTWSGYSFTEEEIGDRLGILATDAQGNQYIDRDDAPATIPSKEDFYPVDEGDLQTIGERETGFSRAQLNALDPAELFGMLAPELRLKVLNPAETGVEVGEHDRELERHLDAVEERVNKTALIRDSKGDYSKSAAAVERYRTHPGVRELAERRRINLDEMSAQEIKKLMSARNKKLKAAEKTRRRERAYHERYRHTYD